MKDYGFMEPPPTFMERHGKDIGKALCTIVVFGTMIMTLILTAPDAIERMSDHSAEIVATATGAEQ